MSAREKEPAIPGRDWSELIYNLLDNFFSTSDGNVTNNLVDTTWQISRAIDANFTSPNECDSNLEHANVVDGLFSISRAIHHLARAVEGQKPTPEKPETNGHAALPWTTPAEMFKKKGIPRAVLR